MADYRNYSGQDVLAIAEKPAAQRTPKEQQCLSAIPPTKTLLEKAESTVRNDMGLAVCRSASNPDPHRRATAPSLPALRCAARLQTWRCILTT